MLEVQGALAGPARTSLVALTLLAGSVWVGSLACLALLGRTARRTLPVPAQVALFRSLGRLYGIFGTASLLIAIGSGLALAWPPARWGATIDAALALSGLLVLSTGLGMAQARSMTRLRRRAGAGAPPADLAAALRRGRALATGLRLFMSALSLAVVILAAQAMTR